MTNPSFYKAINEHKVSGYGGYGYHHPHPHPYPNHRCGPSLCVNNPNERLGDCILSLPAVEAFIEIFNREIDLYVKPIFRGLWESIPGVNLVDEPHESPDVVPNCQAAFDYAATRGLHFTAGYFPQFNLRPDQGKPHYRIHGAPFDQHPEREEKILIVPYARSCARHKGLPANLEPDAEWWLPILERLPFPAFTLGTKEDKPLPGTQPLFDMAYRDVVWEMRKAAVLISVETGPLHLATTAKIPTIFLSSATPESFARPGCRCWQVRSPRPNWDQAKVIEAVKMACEEFKGV